MTSLRLPLQATLLRSPATFAFDATSSPWSLSMLKSRFSQRALHPPMTEDPRFSRLLDDDKSLPFGRFLRRLRRLEEKEALTDLPYLRNIWLCNDFPELVGEVEPMVKVLGNNFLSHPLLADVIPNVWQRWIELFISPRGVRYPEVHVDTHHTHAWLAQLEGTKRVSFWPPKTKPATRCGWSEIEDATRSQRIDESELQIDVDEHTNLDKVFSHAPPFEVLLEAGNLAIIPAGWWHTTETLETSLTLSGNFVGPDNLRDFMASVAKKAAASSKIEAVYGEKASEPAWECTLDEALSLHGPTLLQEADALLETWCKTLDAA
ncbi:MAG: hypothetical protein GY822_16785 [Deltaproteobacteria bacterium]|nr:hypothetical protein [Deltaproteobacteria bacterium]